MRNFMLGVLLTLAIAAGLGLFMKSRNIVAFGRVHRGAFLQPTGDPPVTVSDGSLHAHSQSGWVSPNESPTITPNGKELSSTSCPDVTGLDDNWWYPTSHEASVTFWADDTDSLDISPPGGSTTQIVIQYASTGGMVKKPNVTINASAASLTITTDADSFLAEPSHSDNHDRSHSRDGEVEQITISGANYTGNNRVWIPQNPKHPHFTLGFCFK
jgi:hypothetical protein